MLFRSVRGGARRCAEVCGGARRCAEVRGGVRRCAEVRGGARRCAEVCGHSTQSMPWGGGIIPGNHAFALKQKGPSPSATPQASPQSAGGPLAEGRGRPTEEGAPRPRGGAAGVVPGPKKKRTPENVICDPEMDPDAPHGMRGEPLTAALPARTCGASETNAPDYRHYYYHYYHHYYHHH